MKSKHTNDDGVVIILFDDGSVECSGDANHGGDAGSKQSQLTDVESIASTEYAFAAKKSDGTVVAWGSAIYGGDPGSKQSKLIDIILIASARLAFAAMTRDGSIICWGHWTDFDIATAKCQRLK